jgi:hypothetical protein
VLRAGEEFEANAHFTADKNEINTADVIVFNLHHLFFQLNEELIKQPGQIWVAWNIECEKNYTWLLSTEIRSLIDIWIDYHPNSDVPIPYLNETFVEKIQTAVPTSQMKKNVCMFISSQVNNSRRVEYIAELMQYIHIDSYGRLFRNAHLSDDDGYKSKQKMMSEYKFAIAFENAISDDYVTEKFFDPLLVGTIPIYLGAPNIDIFSPGKNAFVDVRNYPNPKDLANKLNHLCQDIHQLDSFYQWKKYPLNDSFIQIADLNRISPFERLVAKIEQYKQPKMGSEWIEMKLGRGVLKGKGLEMIEAVHREL